MNIQDKKVVAEMFDIMIQELKKNHLLKNTTKCVYDDVSFQLKEFYRKVETDQKLKRALSELQDDLYYNIIPFYYKNRYTIENIAEMFNVDVSTIVRNKKRLCLSIYLLLQ